MNAEIKSQMELSAVLNLVPYLDEQFNISDKGTYTLGDLVKNYSDSKEDDKIFKLLADAVDGNDALENIQIVHQSSEHGNPNKDLIQAVTFKDTEGNYYVSYRGTGDGRWADNGKGMVEESTEMQEAAADYFDKVVEELSLVEEHKKGKTINVTGHSKGGNEAQYVYMASDYEFIIDNCYNFDGQGFSEAAIEKFIREHPYDYDQKLENMYAVCGENDYVHPQGIRLVPIDNTYYVPTQGEGFADYHRLECMIKNENGEYVGLPENWETHKYQKGPLCEYSERLSEEMMKMNLEDREGAAMIMMSAMDMGNETVGEIDLKWYDYVDGVVDFLDDGVPIAMDAAVAQIINEAYEKYGTPGAIAASAIMGGISYIVSIPLKTVKHVIKVVDFVIDSFEKIVEIAKDIGEFIYKLTVKLKEAYNAIRDWVRSKTSGGKYADSNSYVKVDVTLLRTYAKSLDSVNYRIEQLDKSMNSLYKIVGWKDLLDVIKINLATHYSPVLAHCESYLRETAKDYENVEKTLAKKL